ncbi:MAG: hypothetical protein DWP95_11930 [Proteobacteria bacterium]|nr:MAG: hypothetical protein DWP95_11930 [Pseudomonadota bacterium]
MDNKDNDIIEEKPESDHAELQESHAQPEDSELTSPKQGARGVAVLSLFLALLALVTAGWVFYRMEFQGEHDQKPVLSADFASQQDLTQLQNRITALENKLSQQSQNSQQNQQQIKQLQQALNSLPDTQFDDSLLQQQINTLQQQFDVLKTQYQDQSNEPQTDTQLKSLTHAQAVHALQTVQLLINQQQLPQAIEILKQWRNHKHLPLAIQTRLQQLITTLSNLESPDIDALKQQLTAVKQKIAQLSLIAEHSENSQPAWYERFITVKKIKPAQQGLNSIDLQQLKADASLSLQQAELALILKQPKAWQDALKESAQVLAQADLDSDELQQVLQQLSSQNIIIQVPNNLGIDALIQQIEGITE